MLRRLVCRLAGQRGVTLIELMVTLMVVSILMGITIPTVSTYISRQELKASAREVVTVMREARQSAMDEGQPRYVLFIPGNRSYRIYRYDPTTGWVPESPEERFDSSVSFTDGDVTFPTLLNTPETLAIVPENAAYFDTRGRYPFGYDSSYAVTLRSRGGQTQTLTLYTATGQVTGL